MCVLHSPSAVRLPVRISGRLNGTALQIQIDKFKIIVLVFFFEWSCLFWDLFLHRCAGNRSGRLLSYRGFRLRDTGSPPSCPLIRRRMTDRGLMLYKGPFLFLQIQILQVIQVLVCPFFAWVLLGSFVFPGLEPSLEYASGFPADFSAFPPGTFLQAFWSAGE